MKISSDEIPQADNLIDVVKTVIAVSQGARTFQQIAQFIEKGERQGRYYRKAAEIVGLISTPSSNHSILTPLGQSFIHSNPVMSNPALLRGFFNSRIFQRIIPFLELKGRNGVLRDEFINFLNTIADLGGDSMAKRRISTITSWLIDLEIIRFNGAKYYLLNTEINNRLENIEFNNTDEPLLPSSNDLQEYNIVQQRTSSVREAIITYRNAVAVERADNAHRHLVNLTSERIRNAGALPKYNQLIDLATHIEGTDFIFEMKSTTDTNEKSQMRAGLSQLYEYRYLQNKPTAKLILVIENPLSTKEKWRHGYLEEDRDIYLVWDGNNELYGNERTRNDLNFLGLIQE